MVRTARSLKKTQAVLLATALLSTSVLASCAPRLRLMQNEAPASQSAPASAPVSENAAAPANFAGDSAMEAATIAPNALQNAAPVPQPQLVKTAALTVTVESIETAIESVTTIVRQQQGEVMNLQDETPDAGERHVASIQLRVPQSKLDGAIAALSELGAVQQQTLKAEDVSNQLVDYEARLRNLRRAEATVLKIMDRSGNIGDVLKVAQELNTIRQSIEQINAQLNDLQNQVSYSTIDIQLETEIVPLPAQPSVQTQITNSWNEATQSIAKVTVDLMQLGIWLMVYSPYLLLIVGAATLIYWRQRRSTPSAPQE